MQVYSAPVLSSSSGFPRVAVLIEIPGIHQPPGSKNQRGGTGKPEEDRHGTFPSQNTSQGVREIPVERDQAVSQVALLVPEQRPLDTGRQPVADDIDAERDREQQELDDKKKPGLWYTDASTVGLDIS